MEIIVNSRSLSIFLSSATNFSRCLVAHIVKKYAGAAETDDLISVGSIGLIKAINTYRDGKGTQLATYTARCIENENHAREEENFTEQQT